MKKLFPELSIALFFECKSINDIVEKINTELSQGTLTYQGNLTHSEITQTLEAIKSTEIKTKNGSSVDITTEVRTKITDILSEALGLAPHEIDPTTNMEEYGVDSVAIMKVTAELEKLFPEISIALFFECKSIIDIVSRITEELNNGTLTYTGQGRQNLLSIAGPTTSIKASLTDNNFSETLISKVKTVITEVLSEALGIEANEINSSISLEEYGVDSVAIMKVTSELEKLFSGISIALFFESKTINDIAEKNPRGSSVRQSHPSLKRFTTYCEP
ncbi:MAG: acyl carrier protein [Sporocytophaga sp.]|nr:acyl carrier protein [Sporocytophaga sp.]